MRYANKRRVTPRNRPYEFHRQDNCRHFLRSDWPAKKRRPRILRGGKITGRQSLFSYACKLVTKTEPERTDLLKWNPTRLSGNDSHTAAPHFLQGPLRQPCHFRLQQPKQPSCPKRKSAILKPDCAFLVSSKSEGCVAALSSPALPERGRG